MKSVQGILTSSVTRSHDYRHANLKTKTIQPSKVNVFFVLNDKSRRQVFNISVSLQYHVIISNFESNKYQKPIHLGLDLHDKFCRHILSARRNSR